jgi:hypothetical protein
MKKIITLLLSFFCFFTFAQESNRIERLKAMRVAYISDNLQLTPLESEKFWPLFNQFDAKEIELKKNKRKLMIKLRKTDKLSETEIAKLMDEDDTIETEIQQNRKQFTTSLKAVIPTQKILKLRQLEIEFKQKLLERIKEKRVNKK